MQVSTVSAVYERQLRRLAEDPRGSGSATLDPEPVHIPFVSHSGLPLGMVVHQPTPSEEIALEALKTAAQETILPCIGAVWPQAEPFVTGVQAIWATKEFWDAISDETVDTTTRSIAGVRAAQKVVSALLLVRGAPTLPHNINLLGGVLMATTDGLYGLRDSPELKPPIRAGRKL